MLNIIRVLSFSIYIILLPGCDRDNFDVYSGYSYGDFIYLSFPETAKIDSVLVKKGDRVKVGQPLVKMDVFTAENALRRVEEKYQSEVALLRNLETGERQEELNIVRAQLERAQSSASQAKRQLGRYRQLYLKKMVSAQEWENSKDDYAQKNAQLKELKHQLNAKTLPARKAQISSQASLVEAARLERDKARWDEQQNVIVSPHNARVYDVLYHPGERPFAGRPIISLLPAENIKIRFFIPEKALGAMQVGKKVRLSCDGCKAIIPGVISFISPEAEYTPPVIYSTKRREKLIFMAEAVPAGEQIASIKIGQPFNVDIITDE
ncbi:MAG TPA: HlyD family efflux transporter periplasmic adaptor subunit [Enterobacteriaceae bacterium]|nr:HlyD family efflux transporter periplasmic adaptor subunit [Enterobacteriaceae bacterium]